MADPYYLTHTGAELDAAIAIAQNLPQLNAPTIANTSGTILTLTNPSTNGNFAAQFAIYVNGTQVATQNVAVTTYNFASHVTTAGTYTITAKTTASGFYASAASNTVTYTST